MILMSVVISDDFSETGCVERLQGYEPAKKVGWPPGARHYGDGEGAKVRPALEPRYQADAFRDGDRMVGPWWVETVEKNC